MSCKDRLLGLFPRLLDRSPRSTSTSTSTSTSPVLSQPGSSPKSKQKQKRKNKHEPYLPTQSPVTAPIPLPDTTFHPFPLLPSEIRLQIWRLAAELPPLHRLLPYRARTFPRIMSRDYGLSVKWGECTWVDLYLNHWRPLLQVSREARTEAERVYEVLDAQSMEEGWDIMRI